MAKREAEELKRQQEQTALQKAEELAAKKSRRGSHHGGTECGPAGLKKNGSRQKEQRLPSDHQQACKAPKMSWIVRKRPAVARLPLLKAPKKVGRREDDRNDRNPAIPCPQRQAWQDSHAERHETRLQQAGCRGQP